MSVTLSPSGTRGVNLPKFARPLMKAGGVLSHMALRILGDRMRIQGQRLLVLTTVGAKTGKRRQTVLAAFADPGNPEAWLVIGSAGGSARHPSWCHNLVRNPDQVSINVGGEDIKVHPQSLHGAERDEIWKRVVSLAPGYGRYEKSTDRQIPIIRLTPKTERDPG